MKAQVQLLQRLRPEVLRASPRQPLQQRQVRRCIPGAPPLPVLTPLRSNMPEKGLHMAVESTLLMTSTDCAAAACHCTAQGQGRHLEIGHEVRQVGGLHRLRIWAPQRERALQHVQRWTAIRANGTHMRPPPAQCSTLQLQHSAHLGVCVPVPLDMLQQHTVQTEWVTRRQQPSQLPPSLRNATMCARQSRITGDCVAVTLLRHRNITSLFADGL